MSADRMPTRTVRCLVCDSFWVLSFTTTASCFLAELTRRARPRSKRATARLVLGCWAQKERSPVTGGDGLIGAQRGWWKWQRGGGVYRGNTSLPHTSLHPHPFLPSFFPPATQQICACEETEKLNVSDFSCDKDWYCPPPPSTPPAPPTPPCSRGFLVEEAYE